MNFSEKREHPYTKPVTIQKFSVNNKGTAATSLQNDVLSALNNLGSNAIDLPEDIHIKCRKYDNINNKLLIFFSWYDDKLDVSTTQRNASDAIISQQVNNADICHLFLSIEKNTIWAFATISSLHLDKRLSKTLWNLLNNNSLEVCQEPDIDTINIIKKEHIKYIGIEGPFDLLAVGFRKKNIFSAFESEKTEKSQIHHGTLIIDKKGNTKIIQNIEDNPSLALDYIGDEGDKSVYIQTSRRKIDSNKLTKKIVLYLKPIGKTKTVSWNDAKEIFVKINDY